MSNKNKNNNKPEVKVPDSEPLNINISKEDKEDLKELQEVSDKVEEMKKENIKEAIKEEDKKVEKEYQEVVEKSNDVEVRIKLIKDTIALREETLEKTYGAEQSALIAEEIRELKKELKELTGKVSNSNTVSSDNNKLVGSELSVKDRRIEYRKNNPVSMKLTGN